MRTRQVSSSPFSHRTCTGSCLAVFALPLVMRAQLLVLPDDSISVAAHDYAHSRRHGVMLPSLNPSTLTALIAVTARRAETRYASHQLEYQWTLGLEHVPSRVPATSTRCGVCCERCIAGVS